MRLSITTSLQRLTQVLAVALVVFGVAFLVACGDDQDTQTTQATQETQATRTTAASTGASTDSQPATEAPRSVAVPASTDVPPATPPGPSLQVVTTSNIVADWAEVIGGDRVEVFSLHPPGSDPHGLVPGARDVAKVADADVVLSVGLGLEAMWLEDLVHNASADESRVFVLGDGVDPLEFSEADAHGEEMDEHGEEMEEALGRLLIGDGETGALSVIDLEHGEVEQDHFDMGTRAGRIYATKSGRFAIAVSSDANAVNIFDGGIFMEPHGDHFDLIERATTQVDIDLTGDRPVHMYVGEEWATVYYDGSGDFVLINEHELEEEGDSYVPIRMNAGPTHGAVIPLEDDLFAVSLQHPNYAQDPQEYRLPIGAEIWDLDGNVLHSAEGCPDLHGDAGNGHMAVFGCTGGVLALEAHDGEYSHVFVSAPEGSPDDFRLTSVWGYPGLDHFFALGSAVGLYVVEPEEGEMEQLIPATEELRPIQVNLSFDGETLFVVMSDGELRMYEAHDLDMLAAASGFLTTPVETGFWARPHLATAPGAVFITDSVGGKVLQLDDHDLEVVQEWQVAGTPTKIAFVGIFGEGEDHEEQGHMEGEGDHHGHDHGPLDPHFWFDPNRVKIAVNDMAARLSALDPEGAAVYHRNAADYGKQLDELHAWTQEQVELVPPERRLLVTSHDTFAYFADVYGFEVIGALIPSLAPDAEPSAEHLAELVEVIREHNAPAVFGETTVSGRLPEALARETGTGIFQLYADSLGVKGSPAGTYLGMVRANVGIMVEALK